MPKFCYGQYCPLARTLDILGERWTLLIVRELLHGPRTYKMILQNLPDMGAVKLTKRLNSMERQGIIERQHNEPRSAEEPYVLTPKGKKLDGAIRELVTWGLDEFDLPKDYEVYSPLWSLLELQIRFKPELAQHLNMMFELRIENETHHIEISNGKMTTHTGSAPSPLFIITTDAATFILILRGLLSLRQAIHMKRVDVDGSLAALSRTLDILGLRTVELEAPKVTGKGSPKDDNNFPNIEVYPAR